MFEIVAETMRTKVRVYSLAQTQQQMSTRVRFVRIEMRTGRDACLLRSGDRLRRKQGRCGVAMTLEERAEIRAAVSWVAKTSQRIVNALAREAGSRSNYLDSPVQRFQRDVNALATMHSSIWT